MSKKYIGLLDLSGIQDHLFRKPELQAIAKASQSIEDLGKVDGLFVRKAKEAGAEPIVHAGGNAVLIADSEEKLKAAFRAISRELLESGEGLGIVGAIHPYEEGQLAHEFRKAGRILERRKFTQARNTDFVFSGMKQPESVNAKKENKMFPKAISGECVEPTETKYLIVDGYWKIKGRDKPVNEKTDLMAVVSVDGLGMGQRLLRWINESANKKDEPFIQEYSAWSGYVKKRWGDAWKSCLTELQENVFPLAGNVRRLEHPYQAGRFLQLKRTKDGGHYFPVRKIYQGGDDLSFICDARIALSFTASLIHHLEATETPENVPKLFHSITVSAGVVFVDSHFPFSRAVTLSDDVRQVAKKLSAETKNNEGLVISPSCIDWWLNRQGALEREEIRYSLRPYLMTGDVSWEQFEEKVLPKFWDVFGKSRNKLKDLLGAAEQGKHAVERMLTMRPIDKMNELKNAMPEMYRKDALFSDEEKHTPIVDAGEIFDIHFPYPSKEVL
jgi:CRISPR/Cas system-associated protein Cas10 (large subunit of type III CRISPR-Cas system)